MSQHQPAIERDARDQRRKRPARTASQVLQTGLDVWLAAGPGVPPALAAGVHALFEQSHGPIRVRQFRPSRNAQADSRETLLTHLAACRPKGSKGRDLVSMLTVLSVWDAERVGADESTRACPLWAVAASPGLSAANLVARCPRSPDVEVGPLPRGRELLTSDGARNVLVHVPDSRWADEALMTSLLGYAVLQAVVALGLVESGYDFDSRPEGRAHPRLGCLFDPWDHTTRAHMLLKVRAGDICKGCQRELDTAGISGEIRSQVIRLLETFRRGALEAATVAKVADHSYLPFPVAVACGRAAAIVEEPYSRLKGLLDYLDCILRYTLFAQAALGRMSQLKIDANPTLGTWVGMLNRACVAVDGADHRVRNKVVRQRLKDALPAAKRLKVDGADHRVRNKVVRQRLGDALPAAERLTNFRNWCAHSYINIDTDYSNNLALVEKAVAEVEKALEPLLREHRLIRWTHCKQTGELLGVSLMGESFILRERSFTASIPPRSERQRGLREERGRVGLWNARACRFYPMDPYLVWNTCPSCRRVGLLLADGRKTDGEAGSGSAAAVVNRYICVVEGVQVLLPSSTQG
jgi:hypothetical protein